MTTSFDQLYAAHAPGLTLQLLAYTGDLATAQGLVHEAFCRALARWKRISRADDPVAWIRRVAWRLASGRRLRPRRARTAADPDPNRSALLAALAELPATSRRAVVLHYLGDLNIAEIAHQEGVPDSTAMAWLRSGRAELAALLAAAPRTAVRESCRHPGAAG